MSRRGLGWALLGLMLAAPVEAQHFGRGGVTAGFEGLTYRFGQEFGVRSLDQWTLPLGVVVPAGRFVFDAGVYLASTTLTRLDGTSLTVTGFTDTQVRAAYAIGDDDVVVTVVANLPTGASDLTAAEYAVVSATSSSFLNYPVNAYSTGPSLTAGAAAAVPAGAWSIGMAASARFNGEFTPFVDPDGAFTYEAGIEGRARVGADRLVGSGRLTLGLTVSTFSSDQFSSGGGVPGSYKPGTRFILEGSYATTVGDAALSVYLWDFLRLAGDSAGLGAANRENVVAGGARFLEPLSRIMSLEAGVEGRLSLPEEGLGGVVELTVGLPVRIGRRLHVIPAARLDIGRLEEPDPGIGHSLRGYGFSVFLRESF